MENHSPVVGAFTGIRSVCPLSNHILKIIRVGYLVNARQLLGIFENPSNHNHHGFLHDRITSKYPGIDRYQSRWVHYRVPPR